MMISLRCYQETSMDAVRKSFAAGNRAPMLVLPTGGGKCHGIDTPILMYDGTVKMVQDVIVGDQIMGPDSKPRNVLSLARGREMLYRVKPVKGDSYVVNESHILSLKQTNTNSKPKYRSQSMGGQIVNISVRDYLKKSKHFKHIHKGWRAAVDFKETLGPSMVEPYFLGLWLGDGTYTQPEITTGDQEIIDYLGDYAKRYDMDLSISKNSENSVYVRLKEKNHTGRRGSRLTNELKAIGVIGNKHIPHRYKTSSRENRLSLLAGILDSDGYYSGKDGFDVILKSEKLMDDVIFLARSLGFSAYKKPCKKTCVNTGATGDYFRCYISGNVNRIPCLLARHKAQERKQKKDVLVTGISVEPIGQGDYFGFEIDGDHLYLLGDFTVTHNTTIFSYIAKSAAGKGKNVWILVHRAELVKQVSATLARFELKHNITAQQNVIRQAMVEHIKKFSRSFVDVKNDQVFVCSTQTVVNRLDKMPAPDLIIVDEAHHCIADNTWGKIISAYPDAKVLLVTATPRRLDGKGLGVDSGGIADDLVIGPNISDLIELGFLSKFKVYGVPPENEVDVTGVSVRMGDYAKGELDQAIDKPKVYGDAVEHYLQICNGKRAVAFTPSVNTAIHLAEKFQASGINADYLDGSLTPDERDARIKRFEAGDILVLTSCDLISEGFDLPAIECAILLRPTKSISLYIQQVGRALRVFPGKEYAIILDHVGNVDRHGFPDDEHDWTLEGEKEKPKRKADDDDLPEVKVQKCPMCYAKHKPAPCCPACSYSYPVKSREVQEVSGKLVEKTREDVEKLKRRVLQGKAQSLDQLLAMGMSRGRAEKVLAAREAKSELIGEVLNAVDKLGSGLHSVTGVTTSELRKMKPKEIKKLLSNLGDMMK